MLANTLALNGGDIESKATDTDAGLSHTGLKHNAEHKVDWQLIRRRRRGLLIRFRRSDHGADYG